MRRCSSMLVMWNSETFFGIPVLNARGVTCMMWCPNTTQFLSKMLWKCSPLPPKKQNKTIEATYSSTQLRLAGDAKFSFGQDAAALSLSRFFPELSGRVAIMKWAGTWLTNHALTVHHNNIDSNIANCYCIKWTNGIDDILQFAKHKTGEKIMTRDIEEMFDISRFKPGYETRTVYLLKYYVSIE